MPLARGLTIAVGPGRARGVGLPRRKISRVGLALALYSAPNDPWCNRTATPTYASLRRRDPGRTQTRFRRVQAQLPSPSRRHPTLLATLTLTLRTQFCFRWAAPEGPERHCRERRGPSTGDGQGNRGASRARLLCTDREHGGTLAVSRRTGSPREARSEGPAGGACRQETRGRDPLTSGTPLVRLK